AGGGEGQRWQAGVVGADVAGLAGPYFFEGVAGLGAAGPVRDGPAGGVQGDVGVQAGQCGGQQRGCAVPGDCGGGDFGAQRGAAEPAGGDVEGGGAVGAEQRHWVPAPRTVTFSS